MMSPNIEPLHAIATSGQDRPTRAHKAAEWIRATRGYHWVGLYDVTPSHIAAIAWTGPTAPAHPMFARSEGLNGAAVAAATSIVVQDVRKDPRYLTTFGATLAEAIFPVRASEGGIVGTIDIESDHANAFTPEDEVFLWLCADALSPLWA